jgi:hypothetical protein
VTCGVLKAHIHHSFPSTLQPVSSGVTLALLRTSSTNALYVGFALLATRAIAWHKPPRLTCNPKACWSTVAVLP